MKKSIMALSVSAALLAASAYADQNQNHQNEDTIITKLDHVFVIMMENHGYSQILNNPNAPFINNYAKTTNLATNYFAIAHPSLTNYLEVVGGDMRIKVIIISQVQ